VDLTHVDTKGPYVCSVYHLTLPFASATHATLARNRILLELTSAGWPPCCRICVLPSLEPNGRRRDRHPTVLFAPAPTTVGRRFWCARLCIGGFSNSLPRRSLLRCTGRGGGHRWGGHRWDKTIVFQTYAQSVVYVQRNESYQGIRGPSSLIPT
jgi:hypothetical protein